MQAVGRGGELRAELVERPEGVVDGGRELPGGLVPAVGREVLPPDRVVHMAAEVEGEVLLVEEDRGVVVLGPGLLELGHGGVDAGDIGGVVLAVVQLVDLAGDVRLQGAVVPIQIGQGVFSHVIPSSMWSIDRLDGCPRAAMRTRLQHCSIARSTARIATSGPVSVQHHQDEQG